MSTYADAGEILIVSLVATYEDLPTYARTRSTEQYDRR